MYEYIESFKRLGFGLFIHFGLYSVLGEGEWAQKMNEIPSEKYDALADKFNVRKDWAKKLVKTAKTAGCKYITLTTRHHDGFSLYDTKGLSDFDAPHSACGRDLVREFVDECNKEGVVPFFYHTLLDWKVKEYNENFPAYIDYLVKSIEVLCTSYGKIGGLWFDGKWDKPDADWQEDRIYATIRKYQPEAMIINNTGLNAQGQTGNVEIDSVTFERGKPTFVDTSLKPIAGEMCEGMTDHWGYAKRDICVKPATALIETLVDCRKYDCNLLLNSGPTGKGYLTDIERAELLQIGRWIKINKNFVYNAHSCDVTADGADVLYDGTYYYAVIKNVLMSADPNVANGSESRTVTISANGKIRSAIWLDSGEKVCFSDKKSFKVVPFSYGSSLGCRVVRFKLA